MPSTTLVSSYLRGGGEGDTRILSIFWPARKGARRFTVLLLNREGGKKRSTQRSPCAGHGTAESEEKRKRTNKEGHGREKDEEEKRRKGRPPVTLGGKRPIWKSGRKAWGKK